MIWESVQLQVIEDTDFFLKAHGEKRGAEGEGTNRNDQHFKCHIFKSKFAYDYRQRQHKKETGHQNTGKGWPKK